MPPVSELSPATWTLLATGALLVGLVTWALLRGDVPAPRRARARARADRGTGGEPSHDTLLELRGVTREYVDNDGATVVGLAPSDLAVRQGEMVGIIGPSGLGKSTLLNILGGIDVPSGGEVWFEGRVLPRDDGEEIRRYRSERVSFVFQDLNLVTHLSAEDNAALPLVCQGMARPAARARARAHLERLGVGELAGRKPSQLSGGQKQRVAIARAFTSDAPLILADEPTGSLDPHTALEVMDAFVELARGEGRTVVFVTHATGLARRYCDRVVKCTADGLVDVPRDREESSSSGGRPRRRARPVRNGASA